MKFNLLLFAFILLSPSEYLCTVFLGCTEKPNFKRKISSSVNQKKTKTHQSSMSRTLALTLNFDQWKTFSKTKKFDYDLFKKLAKIIVVHDSSPSSFKLKRCILSLDKVGVLFGRLLVISSQNISCELYSSGTNSLRYISYLSLRL